MGERAESALASVVLAGVAVGFVYFCHWLSWPLVDDAGVSLAFGRTLFEGAGLRVTPGSQVVEGFSSPLWVIVQGLGTVLPLDGVAWSKWGGVVCAAVGLVVAAWWAPVAEGRPLRLEDAAAPAMAAMNPSFAAWASSGMEVGVWTLSLAAAGVVALRAMRTGAALQAGLVLGGLVLVRPEAPLFVLAVVPIWLLVGAGRGRALRELGLLLAGAAVVLAGVLAVRWWVFSDVLPNTWWAKRAWHLDGATYLRGFVQIYELAVWAAAAGLFIAVLWKRFKVPHVALAAAWVLCIFAFALNGDWMSEWRFGVPALPFLGVVAMAGVDAARRVAAGGSGSMRRLAFIGGLSVVAMSSVAAFDGFARRVAVKQNPQFAFDDVRAGARTLRAELEALGQRRPLLVFPDVGGLAWELRDAEVSDPVGLCDRAVTAHVGDLAALDDYFSSEGPPVAIDVRGPSAYLGSLPGLMAQMEHTRGSLWTLRGLTAMEDPRCPDGKAGVVALSADQAVAALEGDLARDDALVALRRWRCLSAYVADERLPDRAERRELAARAMERSGALEREGKIELALRQASFAAVVSGQASLRRRTELLRTLVFAKKTP